MTVAIKIGFLIIKNLNKCKELLVSGLQLSVESNQSITLGLVLIFLRLVSRLSSIIGK